ncbi:phage holin, lambda family [Brenneria populi subsp. brevivirga]|uniref:Phage holin, lambda family n=1 Tax=Brenneria populi TaxID=1505588 RepID=A0ABU6JT46_9GAMM|nr:phage holin, lambda family [Brenneria populi subsp. brevivirga]MEC5343677.1 phage holin, lambda family [Brenneria populi Li et al. 2015]
MKMPDKNPDLWAQIIAWFTAWFTAHKEEAGYSAAAAIMALLRGAYVGQNSWSRRLLDAAMCSLVAYYINDGLAALGWDSSWASIGSVFIGFLGIDYISSILRRAIGNKTGDNPQA